MALPPALRGWPASAGQAGILLDFDGTLASIVDDPAAVRPLPGVIAVLQALARRYALVGVISGRPAAWLAVHIPIDAVARWGSYGLEHVVGDTVDVVPEAEHWRDAISRATARARGEAPAGVVVEDKDISVTIHVRRAPSGWAWAKAFADSEALTTGLAVHAARQSVELRPPLAVDKGSVVTRLVAGLGAACFVGDDIGDLSAFQALSAVPVPVRVAVRSPESPPELLAAADVVVEGPEGVLHLLRGLAA